MFIVTPNMQISLTSVVFFITMKPTLDDISLLNLDIGYVSEWVVGPKEQKTSQNWKKMENIPILQLFWFLYTLLHINYFEHFEFWPRHCFSIRHPSQRSSAQCMCNVCMIYDPSPSIMHNTVLVFAEASRWSQRERWKIINDKSRQRRRRSIKQIASCFFALPSPIFRLIINTVLKGDRKPRLMPGREFEDVDCRIKSISSFLHLGYYLYSPVEHKVFRSLHVFEIWPQRSELVLGVEN